MSSKLVFVFVTFCILQCFVEVRSSFIKPNNVPRVGRSSEADGPFDQSMMGYVIKTIPSKNIPRMGRRNYDSGNRFDIPKLYQLPADTVEYYEAAGNEAKMAQEQEDFFGSH